MAFGFNPFTGNFDLTGGGDAAPFAGQVDAYADLPLDTTAALNSRWLVKNNSGTWPFSSYKQAGIYIRVSTVGASRDTDYQFVGTLPSVMNDSEFLIYDDTDATKNLKFQLSGITTGTTRTLTAPDANITIENTGHAAKHHTGGTDAIAPNNISAQWELVASGQFIAGDTVLSSGRNRRITLSVVTTANVDLPYENNVNGDVVAFVKGQTGGATATIRRADALSGGVPFAWSTLATLTTVGQSFTFVSDGTATGWTLRDVDTHTHAASAITSGVFDNARINFAAPEAIGNTTPAAGSFTTLTSSSDTEVTDSTKGVILKSPNNTRWRITINDDGTLARAALALMTLLAFATSGLAQVRDIVTDTNGNIITGRTNELVWSNNLRFTPLTNATGPNLVRASTNGTLTTGSVPSGAATVGSVLQSDGSGGSTFSQAVTNLTSFRTTSALRAGPAFNAGLIQLQHSDGTVAFAVQYNGIAYFWAKSMAIGHDISGGPAWLEVEAADTLALRRTTNPQQFRTYGTWVSSTNYRRLSIGMSNSGIAYIYPEQAGASTNGTNFLHISGLPTNNPGVGILWNSNGAVMVGN